MNKKLKVLLSVVAMSFVMVGCGGGGSNNTTSSIPEVDNAVLADGENQYGYFGEDVIYGSSLVTGRWQIEVGSDGHGYGSSFSLYSDGDYQEGDYGISKDGRVLIHSYGEEITITDALENDCYKISVYDVNYKDTTNGTMCREGNID